MGRGAARSAMKMKVGADLFVRRVFRRGSRLQAAMAAVVLPVVAAWSIFGTRLRVIEDGGAGGSSSKRLRLVVRLLPDRAPKQRPLPKNRSGNKPPVKTSAPLSNAASEAPRQQCPGWELLFRNGKGDRPVSPRAVFAVAGVPSSGGRPAVVSEPPLARRGTARFRFPFFLATRCLRAPPFFSPA